MKHPIQLARSELVNISLIELIKLRLPWLIIGLLGGLVASLIVSKYELSLRENIALVFFIPVIAYMSDAIGTQTETIFIRALTDLKFNILTYILREFVVGSVLGSVVGAAAAIGAFFLSSSVDVSYVVGISIFLSMSAATILACLVPIILRYFKKDPAVASGPFTTALQDIVSITIYLGVANSLL
ncbi:magnesium transporter [Candidatus Daviesbacteria bacterium]|nr:magnesium transporter [Candidatus Daviesbacteria bacterium]